MSSPVDTLAATADAATGPLAPLLKLDDVLGLKLNADCVVLSACNTAVGDEQGLESAGISGLATLAARGRVVEARRRQQVDGAAVGAVQLDARVVRACHLTIWPSGHLGLAAGLSRPFRAGKE